MDHYAEEMPDRPAQPQWMANAWFGLDARQREVLTRRLAGETLATIGESYGVTRERTRQIETKAREALLNAQADGDPAFSLRVGAAVHGNRLLSEEDLAAVTYSDSCTPRDVLLERLGISQAVFGGHRLTGWWSTDRAVVSTLMARLASEAPFSDDEADSAAQGVGFPADFDWRMLTETPTSKLERTEHGWIRHGKRERDVAYLWLRGQSAPRSIEEIALVAQASNLHAMSERLRRDEQFVQMRPEGTWVLTDWRLKGTELQYKSALDAVLAVLREGGPLDVTQIEQEVAARYPVTSWRIRQCLSSVQIGVMSDGRYGLVENGARLVEQDEPRQPAWIQQSGAIIGLKLPVNHDVVRGSGINTSLWLSWRLGLHHAPSARFFALPGESGELTVRRQLGNCAISSLREEVEAMGMADGCTMAVMLNAETNTADVLHVCQSDNCPAGSPPSRSLRDLAPDGGLLASPSRDDDP